MKLIIKFRLKYPNTARQGASFPELRPSRMDHGEAPASDSQMGQGQSGIGGELPQ